MNFGTGVLPPLQSRCRTPPFTNCGTNHPPPSGRTYTTKPGGSLFFPILATPTGEVVIDKLTAEPGEGRGLMMPRRRRTRKQERDERIAAERAINEQLLRRQRWLFAELEKRRAARAANDPPPF